DRAASLRRQGRAARLGVTGPDRGLARADPAALLHRPERDHSHSSPLVGRWREAPEGPASRLGSFSMSTIEGIFSSPLVGRWREAPEGPALDSFSLLTIEANLILPTLGDVVRCGGGWLACL